MKKLAIILTPLFLLIAASAHAALVWDNVESTYLKGGEPEIGYIMYANGGEFYNWSIGYYDPETGAMSKSRIITEPLYGNTQINYPTGAAVNMSSYAGGGKTPNGFYNAVASNLDHTGFGVSDGLIVSQKPISTTFRSFTATSNGTATISGSITGAMNFDTQNFDWTTNAAINPMAPYWGYRFTSIVEINTFSKTMGLLSETPTSINLNNGLLNDSITIDLVNDPDIYYVLHTNLVLNTWARNNDPFMEGIIPLTDQFFKLGSWNGSELLDPLTVTASVTLLNTPVPGSLLLLVSGIGGLLTTRRRFNSKTCD